MVRGSECPQVKCRREGKSPGGRRRRNGLQDEERCLAGAWEVERSTAVWSCRLAKMTTGILGDQKEEEAGAEAPGNKDEGQARWKLLIIAWDWLDEVNELGVGVRGEGRRVSEPQCQVGSGEQT